MEQGKKLLPQIMNNPTAEGGAEMLSEMGMDSEFVKHMHNKYGKYASKFGINKGTVENAVKVICSKMSDSDAGNSSVGKKTSGSVGFDRSKYPSVK